MTSRRKRHPTANELHEWYFYDPDTGLLHWKQRSINRMNWGERAGNVSSDGYIGVGLNGQRYKAHNLIFIMHFGDIPDDKTVDHKDWDGTNNRLDNLRLATGRQQNFHKLNKGFSRNKDCRLRPWQVRHTMDYKQQYVGAFPTALQARLAYERHTSELEPEFASTWLSDALHQLCSEGSTTVWMPG